MLMACFDLEGVFLPEVWIEVAELTGIEGLKLTTRDISDYDELMTGRLKLLKENGITIDKFHEVVNNVKPLEGALEFLDWARSQCQVVILSDTFYQFAEPMMKKLHWPTLLCHNVSIDKDGNITDYHIRIPDPKRKAIQAFRSLNFKTFACGDSFNDVSMLQEADHSAFLHAPKNVLEQFPKIPSFQNFAELRTKLEELIATEKL